MTNKSDRSSLILFDRKAATEKFTRSSHNDFATSAELRARGFDGWRENQLTQNLELWISGEIVKEITPAMVLIDPDAPLKAWAEHFKQDL